MRTKNTKRLWPVPATLGVMALAAFLAFGLMATNGAQPAVAQADPDCTIAITENGEELSLDGECNISGTEATIEFNGYDAEADQGVNRPGVNEVTYFVYGADVGAGGAATKVYPLNSRYFHEATACPVRRFDTTADDFVWVLDDGMTSPVSTAPNNTVMVQVGNKATVDNSCDVVVPLQGKTIKVGAPGISGASSEVLSITGDALDQPTIFAYVGRPSTAVAVGGLEDIDPDSTADRVVLAIADDENADNDELHVQLQFLGPPATKQTANGEPASALGAQFEDTSQDPSVYSMIAESTAKRANIGALDEVRVAAMVKDANGDSLQGTITYIIEFVEGSTLLSGRSSYTTQAEDFDADEGDGISHDVRGWAPKGPVKANVTAQFNGGTGRISLGPIALVRTGNLDSIVAHVCVADSDDEDDKDPCGAESRSRSVFPPAATFQVVHMPVDMLGTELTNADSNAKSSVSLPDAETEKGADVIGAATQATVYDILDYEEPAANGGPPPPAPPIADWYTIHADTPPGMYDITVKASQVPGGKKVTGEVTLTITVGGDPAMYDVSGPESIALTSFASGEYTIKATDEAGNTPAFEGKEAEVSVVVESSLSVRITGLDDGMVILDDETGEATFTVYKPANAMRGDTASIGIFVGDELMDQLSVVFGEPFMAPGMPMNVMAEATSDSDITVSWESPAADGSSDITGYMVQRAYMMADDMMSDWMDVDPAHMGMDMMYMDMGLMAETTYYYRVVAMNSVGMGDYSDGTAMAMTMAMMMPPMELGAAMDLTAMANADGSITLMFTPGTSATHHFVSGNVSAVWEFADGMNMHTVSADQLVSGTEYSFYVISGRFMKADDGTWPGEWSSAGWTNVAKAMAQ